MSPMRNNIEQRGDHHRFLHSKGYKKTPTENDIDEGKKNGNEQIKQNKNLLHIPSKVRNKKPKHKPSKQYNKT